MKFLKMTKSILSSRLLRGASIALAAACLLFAAAPLRASCFDPATSPRGAGLKPEFVTALTGQPGRGPQGTSIVGMWHVVYTGTSGYVGFFYEAFDQWHNDGTEFEIADLPPDSGNVCMGVWKMAGNSVKLYHAGWSFDPYNFGNPIGSFTLSETNTVSSDGNTYTGSFTFKVYDPDGNEIPDQEVSGTIQATRITVP